MAETTRKSSAKRGSAKATPPAPHIALIGIDDAPEYYANHIEVSHNPHEFELLFSRLNARLSEEKMEELVTSGRLETEAILKVVIPTSLLLDMIAVLEIQRDKFEETYGPLLDPSNRRSEK